MVASVRAHVEEDVVAAIGEAEWRIRARWLRMQPLIPPHARLKSLELGWWRQAKQWVAVGLKSSTSQRQDLR